MGTATKHALTRAAERGPPGASWLAAERRAPKSALTLRACAARRLQRTLRVLAGPPRKARPPASRGVPALALRPWQVRPPPRLPFGPSRRWHSDPRRVASRPSEAGGRALLGGRGKPPRP